MLYLQRLWRLTKQLCRRPCFILVLIAVVTGPAVARGNTITLPANKDTSVFSDSAFNSAGGAPGIFTGNSTNGGTRRALISFDFTSIPAGSIITSANLTLYVGTAPMNSPAQTINIFPLTADWGEGTTGSSTPNLSGSGSGAPAVGVDATWTNAFSPTTPWATSGGDFSGTASASVASITATLNTPYNWSSASMVNDVQGWLDDPAANFGWILRNSTETGTQTVRGFYSSESGTGASTALTTAFQPKLTLEYAPPIAPTGDYNTDGDVNAADYVVWRKSFGTSGVQPGSGTDGDQSGSIDLGDWEYWKARFGNEVSLPALGSSVPEPALYVVFEPICLLALAVRKR